MTRLDGRIAQAEVRANIHSLFVKLKFNDFQQTTVERVHSQIDMKIISELLHEGFVRKRILVRLLGVGVKLKSELLHETIQLPLSGLDL